MTATVNARQTARDVQAALAQLGIKRDVDAKRVRSWVRDNIDAYDDDGYTSHQYTPAVHARIVRAMVARYAAGRSAPDDSDQRASSASEGRSKVKSTTTTTPAVTTDEAS